MNSSALALIGFVIAMESETKCIAPLFEKSAETETAGFRVVKGEVCGSPALLVTCGVGKVNAAAATSLALSMGATRIVNAGFAGGLLPDMKVGDISWISAAVQYDFDLSQLNGTPVGTLDGADSQYIPLAAPPPSALLPPSPGVCATGDRFNDSDADYELIRSCGCTVRDMECAAIAQLCQRAQVPFHSFKCVSDVRGNGATPEQFKQNIAICQMAMEKFFREYMPELVARKGIEPLTLGL